MSAPNPPTIASIDQASGTVVVGIAQNQVTGSAPVFGYRLYRAPTPAGPFARVDYRTISKTAIVTFAFDVTPVMCLEQWYAASAVDVAGVESALSGTLSWAAFSSAARYPAEISAAALGPYPLLGSDLFLSPFTGEGVIGPNGDFLTVNSLECLAQDLRIRLYTEVGELLLQPDFGFWRGKLIGSGQGSSQAQALLFETRLKQCLALEPRVNQVLSVIVRQQNYDSWTITYVVMAIGVEDPLNLNQVVPFGIIANKALAS